MGRKLVLIGILQVMTVASVAAAPYSLELHSKMEIKAPRWRYLPDDTVKKPKKARQLYNLKRAELGENSKRCLQLLQKTWKQIKLIRPWLLIEELKCAATSESSKALSQAIERVQQNTQWLSFGAYKIPLRKAYASALLKQFEQRVSEESDKAWRTWGHIGQAQGWLSDRQKGKSFYWAGKLARAQGRFEAAEGFLLNSLEWRKSSEVRKLLRSVQQELGKKPAEEKDKPEKQLTASEKELKHYRRMQALADEGQVLQATRHGVKLITQFPGGKKSDQAEDKILQMYLSVVREDGKRHQKLRQQMLTEMKKCDGSRIYRWARNAVAKGRYKEGLELARQGLDKMKGHPQQTEMARLGAKAAISSGSYGAAKKLLKKLIVRHSGTQAAGEAVFRLGLVHFRQKNYSLAQTQFEKLVSRPELKDFRYRSLYWQWRTLQKQDKTSAGQLARQLVQEYPLTYYGLRAQAALNKGRLKWPHSEDTAVEAQLTLSPAERESWKRLQLLLKAGWLEEAAKELESWRAPQVPGEMVVYARLLTATFSYHKAIKLINEVWEKNHEYVRPHLVRMVFPREFEAIVKKEAQRFDIEKNLIRATMRQESSYQVEAMSSAQAIGLMQMIPLTAREVARKLGWQGKLQLPDDLFDARTSIRFGASYLSRLIYAFDGHIPLALASYNAGIGRLRRWLQARPGLVAEKLSSRPRDEIWIDELPWKETSFYVKAVLRNLLLYRLIESGQIKLKNPVWQ